jgi:hypothetical protein
MSAALQPESPALRFVERAVWKQAARPWEELALRIAIESLLMVPEFERAKAYLEFWVRRNQKLEW